MGTKEKLKDIMGKFLESVDAANSAELAYVESLKNKKQNKPKEEEREL